MVMVMVYMGIINNNELAQYIFEQWSEKSGQNILFENTQKEYII